MKVISNTFLTFSNKKSHVQTTVSSAEVIKCRVAMTYSVELYLIFAMGAVSNESCTVQCRNLISPKCLLLHHLLAHFSDLNNNRKGALLLSEVLRG